MRHLDAYYILSYDGFPELTCRVLLKIGVPADRIRVVVSDDDPAQVATALRSRQVGIGKPVRFSREKFLHDPYLSMVPRSIVEEYYPRTATPARRFISHREFYTEGDERYYAVFDNDVRFHVSNPFRLSGKAEFDHDIWGHAIDALQDPAVWACTFVNQFSWGPGYKDGMPARIVNGTVWHRAGQKAAQSAWVLSNRENHRWYGPVLEDYITTSRYAAEGRLCYTLDEFIGIGPTNTEGSIWKNEDPLSRDTPAYKLGRLRIMGVSESSSPKKPFRKYSRFIYPQIRVADD